MKTYLLRCIETNPQHTRFVVFDGKGTHCGALTVLTEDVFNFVSRSWNGRIEWQGMPPEEVHE